MTISRRVGRASGEPHRQIRKVGLARGSTHPTNTDLRSSRLMFVARVTGSLVATQKVASMTGHKLLIVEPYRVDEKGRDRLVPTGRTFVVVDTLGAGLDEM